MEQVDATNQSRDRLSDNAGGGQHGLAELHAHLYGCIRPAELLRHLASVDGVLWDWYEENFERVYGSKPPARELVERYRAGDHGVVDEFTKVAVFDDDDAGNFDRFGAKGRLIWAGTDSSPERFDHDALAFAKSVKADFAATGITYAELRWFPHEAMLRYFATDHDSPQLRLAVTLDRSDPWPGWEQVKTLALGEHGWALTGIDFCNVEEGHPPSDLASFFTAVHDFNAANPERALAILYHVGESFRDKSLESAIRWVQEAAEMGAHRLGHAIALGEPPEVSGPHDRIEPVSERRDQIRYDLKHAAGLRAAGISIDTDALTRELDELRSADNDVPLNVHYDEARLHDVRRRQDYAMDRVRETGAVIEVCPTSNRRIGGIPDAQHHPIHRFLAANLPVVIGADDPGVFGVSLRDELDWVAANINRGTARREELRKAAWSNRSERLSGREQS